MRCGAGWTGSIAWAWNWMMRGPAFRAERVPGPAGMGADQVRGGRITPGRGPLLVAPQPRRPGVGGVGGVQALLDQFAGAGGRGGEVGVEGGSGQLLGGP